MFLCSKKNRNGLYYLYLMEGVLDPDTGKRKVQIIRSFGRKDEFIKNQPEKYKELAEKYGDRRDKAKAEKETLISKYLKPAEGTDPLSKLPRLMPQNCAHLALHRLWSEDLGMPKFLGYLKDRIAPGIEYSPSEISLYFSALKMIAPSSYLEGCESSPRFLGDPASRFAIDDVYRCLHFLAEGKDQIMRHVRKMVNRLAPGEKSLLFFDCTNCYFETPAGDTYWNRKKALRIMRRALRKANRELALASDRELDRLIETDPEQSAELGKIIESFGDPLRMHGPSKEKRLDLPLVSIALVVDDHAVPIDFTVFPGNRAEVTVMTDEIKKLKEKHGIRNAVVIADGAMNGTANLSRLLGEGMGFAVAKSALSFSSKIRKELDLGSFSKMKDENGKETPLLYRVVDYSNRTYVRTDKGTEKLTVDCKLMITFSKARRERDLALLEENVERAGRAVNSREEVKLQCGGWRQFVRTAPEDGDGEEDPKKKRKSPPQFAESLNQALIDRRKQCAGFAGILFHEAPDSEKLTPEYVSTLYHHQVQIEECFRIMKSDFEIRPLYVRDRLSVTGHVLLCVLALIMLRLIQRRLGEKGRSATAAQIREALGEMKVMALGLGEGRCLYIKSQEARRRCCLRGRAGEEKQAKESEDLGEMLSEVLGTRIKDPVNTLEQLRTAFKLRELSQSEYQRDLLEQYCAPAQSA